MPIEYVDEMLCRRYGWTITELDEQPRDRILQFLTIIRIEGQFESIEQQKMEQELKT